MIIELQAAKELHGDLEVATSDYNGGEYVLREAFPVAHPDDNMLFIEGRGEF